MKSYDELVEAITKLTERVPAQKHQYAWRGQANSNWALHSTLYRRLLSYSEDEDILETQVEEEEDRILSELHRWGIHSSVTRGRLSVLNQLALLQHYGAPTRLLDVTFSPWVAVWFAVQEAQDADKSKNVDGRIFIFDVSDRLINEKDEYRDWEDQLKRPWRPSELKRNSDLELDLKRKSDLQSELESLSDSKSDLERKSEIKSELESLSDLKSEDDTAKLFTKKDWTTNIYAWKPPAIDGRIAAQNSGFIFGGVVQSKGRGNKPLQIPRTTNLNADGHWKIQDVRKSTCLACRVHKFSNRASNVKGNALYTIKIACNAKKSIRENILKLFAYSESSLFPDYPGFATYINQSRPKA